MAHVLMIVALLCRHVPFRPPGQTCGPELGVLHEVCGRLEESPESSCEPVAVPSFEPWSKVLYGDYIGSLFNGCWVASKRPWPRDFAGWRE